MSPIMVNMVLVSALSAQAEPPRPTLDDKFSQALEIMEKVERKFGSAQESQSKRLDGFGKRLDDFDRRLGALERSVQDLQQRSLTPAQVKDLETRISNLIQRLNELDARSRETSALPRYRYEPVPYILTSQPASWTAPIHHEVSVLVYVPYPYQPPSDQPARPPSYQTRAATLASARMDWHADSTGYYSVFGR